MPTHIFICAHSLLSVYVLINFQLCKVSVVSLVQCLFVSCALSHFYLSIYCFDLVFIPLYACSHLNYLSMLTLIFNCAHTTPVMCVSHFAFYLSTPSFDVSTHFFTLPIFSCLIDVYACNFRVLTLVFVMLTHILLSLFFQNCSPFFGFFSQLCGSCSSSADAATGPSSPYYRPSSTTLQMYSLPLVFVFLFYLQV